MMEAMEGIEDGVKVSGRLVKDMRFADYQDILASTEIELQNVIDGLNEATKKYDMKINIKKAKVMKISKCGGGGVKLLIDGQQVEQVDKFKYLGVWITNGGRCEVEIKARIEMAKDAFGKH